MPGLLEGKNAIITGTSRGIGFALLNAFAEAGCNIWACCRKRNDIWEQEISCLAERNHVWIKPIYFDLTDETALKETVLSIRKEKKKIDILINNAGIEQEGSLFQMMPMDEIRTVFDVNVFSLIAFSQYISKMMAKERNGVIINLASIAGQDMTSGYMAYSASKAAVISITKTMAAELASMGIRVNAISPGIAETDMAMSLTEEARENTVSRTLLKRIANPKEIADLAAFLASDKASYITGQVYRIDGGMV